MHRDNKMISMTAKFDARPANLTILNVSVSHCYHDDEKSNDCPVCSRLFNDLAKHLPFAHCAQSRLICTLTGEAMDEHNPPMMLPNGNVYGENVSYLKNFSHHDMAIEDCAKDGGRQLFTEMHCVPIKNRYQLNSIRARLKNVLHRDKKFLDTIFNVIVY